MDIKFGDIVTLKDPFYSGSQFIVIGKSDTSNPSYIRDTNEIEYLVRSPGIEAVEFWVNESSVVGRGSYER
jgi:hypothetical protein